MNNELNKKLVRTLLKVYLFIMKNFLKSVITTCVLGTVLVSCSRVEPNYEGVLMENYGRNGKSDFKTVTGRQWLLWPGTELYQVPMFETSGDPQAVQISAKDAGVFTVDPSYQYQPIRGKGVDIVFNYKHLGINEPEVMMDNVEGAILNKIVVNAFREEARSYTTDSLMNNLNAFEKQVENRLRKDFEGKYFQLNNLTSGLKPPASMAKAIENRNNAVLEKEKIANEVYVAEMRLKRAEIEAKENKVRSESLTDKLLTEKWIESIKSNDKVIISNGEVPVFLKQ